MAEMNNSKKTRIAYPIVEALLSFFAIFFISLGFSDNMTARGYATANLLSRLDSNNQNYFIYSSTMRSLEDDSNVSANYFTAFRRDTDFFRVITYLDEDENFAKVDVNGNGQSYSNYAACSLWTYSNSTRFENLNISLYRDVPRAQELNGYGANGFMFIPDYLADQMIESSNGELKTYDDLVPDYSTMSSEEIKSFVDKYSLSLTNKAGDTLRYKISNIFRVNGFNETYMNGRDMPSATSIGANIGKILGNYLVIVSERLFTENEETLLNFVKNKRFDIYYDLSTVTSIKSTVNQELTCYVKEDSQYLSSQYYSNLIHDSFISHQTQPMYTAFLVFGFIFLVASIALALIVRFKFIVAPRTHLWNILFVLIVAIVINILEKTAGAGSFAFLSFNNFMCGITILVILGVCAFCYFSEKKRWRTKW